MSQQPYGATIRKELTDNYRVFYATSWGTMADHLPNWFIRALNCHRDVLALPGNEGPRQKYMAELTRAERPPLVQYTEFLNDIGIVFGAIGDCFSYRAGQMPVLLGIDRYKNIPVVNMPRHPYPWLNFHVRWRASNMRMRAGKVDPLAWEWKVATHAYFEYLGLRPYTRDEVDVWSAFQGMMQLNNVLGDINAVPRHVPFEVVADDPAVFKDLVNYLSRGAVEYSQEDMDRAYSTRHTLFHGEEPVECDPRTLFEAWPDWKVDAFRKLVTPEAIAAHKSFGYDLFGVDQKPFVAVKIPTKVPRAIFVASVMKSGTVLLRETIEQMTGLRAIEPEVPAGEPDYANEMLIDFPAGTFFSWHSTLTPRSLALLRGSQAKCVFLVRNIYDVILAIYTHLSRDVDAAEGHSIGGKDYFDDKSVEQALSLIISGFTSPRLTWMGLPPLIKQMESFLELAESGHALMISYEEIVADKRQAIDRLMRHFEISLPAARVDAVIAATEPETMRVSKKEAGLADHMTRPEHKLSRDVFKPYQRQMIDLAILATAPRLRERLAGLGYDWVLNADGAPPKRSALRENVMRPVRAVSRLLGA
jgi:Sulfotransferase domain